MTWGGGPEGLPSPDVVVGLVGDMVCESATIGVDMRRGAPLHLWDDIVFCEVLVSPRIKDRAPLLQISM